MRPSSVSGAGGIGARAERVGVADQVHRASTSSTPARCSGDRRPDRTARSSATLRHLDVGADRPGRRRSERLDVPIDRAGVAPHGGTGERLRRAGAGHVGDRRLLQRRERGGRVVHARERQQLPRRPRSSRPGSWRRRPRPRDRSRGARRRAGRAGHRGPRPTAPRRRSLPRRRRRSRPCSPARARGAASTSGKVCRGCSRGAERRRRARHRAPTGAWHRTGARPTARRRSAFASVSARTVEAIRSSGTPTTTISPSRAASGSVEDGHARQVASRTLGGAPRGRRPPRCGAPQARHSTASAVPARPAPTIEMSTERVSQLGWRWVRALRRSDHAQRSAERRRERRAHLRPRRGRVARRRAGCRRAAQDRGRAPAAASARTPARACADAAPRASGSSIARASIRSTSMSMVRGPHRTSRTRPRAASTRWHAASRSSGDSSTSARTTTLRKSGCAGPPTGSVSQTREQPVSSMPASSPSRSTARWSVVEAIAQVRTEAEVGGLGHGRRRAIRRPRAGSRRPRRRRSRDGSPRSACARPRSRWSRGRTRAPARPRRGP